MKNDSKKKPIRGNHSFTQKVPLNDGAVCPGLKRHYKNCAREVVGYLDDLAALDTERFVWPSVPKIVTRCNFRRKTKKPYKKRTVECVLTFLRKQLILTEQLQRFRRGRVRQGWIISQHDAVTVVEDDCCDFQGQRHWEREIETVKDSTGQHRVVKIGPIKHPSVRSESKSVRGSVRSKTQSVRSESKSVRPSDRTLPLQASETENSSKIETAQSLCLSLSEPTEPPPRTQPGALKSSALGKAVAEESSKTQTLAKWSDENYDLMGAMSDRNTTAMTALVNRHGIETVLAALEQFKVRPGDFGGVKNAWSLFLSESDATIVRVKSIQMKEQQRERDRKLTDERIIIRYRKEAAELEATQKKRANEEVGENPLDYL